MSADLLRGSSLSEPVTLLKDVESSDGSGGTTKSEVEVGPDWMQLRPVSGQEQLRAGLTDTHDLYRGRMRYRTDVTRLWRVRRVRDEKVFEIIAPPREIERGRWMELDLVGVA